MRLGVFGGSFDPVHLGHLLLAEVCREVACLDQVWFVPASVSPHKQQRDTTTGQQRVQMLKLATSGHSSFSVCELEIERGGVSYTVETLQQLRLVHPEADLFFLMGADALVDFPTWRDPQKICEIATPIVVQRPSSPPPDLRLLKPFVTSERLQQIQGVQVEMPLIDLSSRELRERVRQNHSIRYRTPRAVEKYIQAQGLYRTRVENGDAVSNSDEA